MRKRGSKCTITGVITGLKFPANIVLLESQRKSCNSCLSHFHNIYLLRLEGGQLRKRGFASYWCNTTDVKPAQSIAV